MLIDKYTGGNSRQVKTIKTVFSFQTTFLTQKSDAKDLFFVRRQGLAALTAY